jgi:hypothetical protein
MQWHCSGLFRFQVPWPCGGPPRGVWFEVVPLVAVRFAEALRYARMHQGLARLRNTLPAILEHEGCRRARSADAERVQAAGTSRLGHGSARRVGAGTADGFHSSSRSYAQNFLDSYSESSFPLFDEGDDSPLCANQRLRDLKTTVKNAT